jgi:O-antigen ligase
MVIKESGKVLSWVIAVGSAAVTCFVWLGGVTDPVNAPKLFLLGAVGFAVFSLVLKFGLRVLWEDFRASLSLSVLFVIFLLTSSFFSNAPFVQTFYGAYGRNTGVLTYLALVAIFLGTLLLNQKDSHKRILNLFVVAGLVNILYCLWVLAFSDPIPWNNTYKRILGLFGNPNFISSFLGMLTGVILALVLEPLRSFRYRLCLMALLLSSIFLIYKSGSIQGIFVALAGVAIVIFFWIRSRYKVILQIGYLNLAIVTSIAVVLGMLQKGPFSFIYKKSVSLRGSYWNAGLNMGESHPLTGVGMDTYGDWYRSARPPVALIDTPGATVLTNASHNVAIDLFASGGYPLFLTYLAILALAAKAVFNLARLNKKFDVIAVSLTVAWVGYLAQSLISINQIGLAIWGWVLSGLLISYEKISRENFAIESPSGHSKRVDKKAKSSGQFISPQLIAGIGFVVGSILAVPPMASDSKWFYASQSRDLKTFKESLVSGYLNPLNSPRIANASAILLNSNLLAEARVYALMGIDFNPDYFESYYILYMLSNSTEQEKEMAMANMMRIDPNNPDLLKIR